MLHTFKIFSNWKTAIKKSKNYFKVLSNYHCIKSICLCNKFAGLRSGRPHVPYVTAAVNNFSKLNKICAIDSYFECGCCKLPKNYHCKNQRVQDVIYPNHHAREHLYYDILLRVLTSIFKVRKSSFNKIVVQGLLVTKNSTRKLARSLMFFGLYQQLD